MESATLTRLQAGPDPAGAAARRARRRRWARVGLRGAVPRRAGRLPRLPDLSRPTTPSTRCCGAATCCTCTCPTSASTAGRPSTRWRSPSALFCSIFGQGGARLMVLGSIASFVALVAGLYRLGRAVLRAGRGRARGAAAAEPLLRREPRRAGLPRHLLLALIVWAVVLEVERRRRGAPVLLAARRRRPAAPRRVGAERRLLAVVLPGGAEHPHARCGYLALAAIAPVLWARVDAIVTGNPLYSLNATAGLAQELERTAGPLERCSPRCGPSPTRIDKLPVLLGALVGAAAGGVARAAARARAARGAACCSSSCSSPRAPPAPR